jgi:hypothetical protein
MFSRRAGSVVMVAVVGAVAAAGCADSDAEPELGDEAQALSGSEYQGSEYQGSEYQGSEYQGSEYQGSEYQGSEYQGATLGGVALAPGTLLYQDRALSVWRDVSGTKQQLFPDRICTYNSSGGLVGCTAVTNALAGVTFRGTFQKNGVTWTGKIRIKSAAADADTKASHPLLGHALLRFPNTSSASRGCAIVPKGPTCDHPNGCRANCDLYLYDLEVVNTDRFAKASPFCPANQRAYAVPGVYSDTGLFTPSSTKFTFVCQNGTIAKCTKWGYRSFGSALKTDNTSTALRDYHQGCIRAAKADYCSNGNSFTKNGTLVDIYDYDAVGSPAGFGTLPAAGLIPSTMSVYPDATAFGVPESAFDKVGAFGIETQRYEELLAQLGGVDDPARGCPGRFSNAPNDDVGMDHDRQPGYGAVVPPYVMIASSTACHHAESTKGKWLHHSCSFCAMQVKTSHNAGVPDRAYCTDPADPRGWDQGCVDRAASVCTSNIVKPMAPHSECAVGPALTNKRATGCIARVCSTKTPTKDYATCCGANGGTWDASCVALADVTCGGYTSGGTPHTFCGSVLSLPPNGN